MKLLTTAAVVALTLTACGGSSGDGEELTEYLPDDATVLAHVDLDEARSQLELPDDADPLATEEVLSEGIDPELPEADLISTAVLGMPPLTAPYQTLAQDPVAEAFDGGAISAAATAQGDELALTVISTDQSFDDIAEALEAEGYEREDDVLAATDPEARIAEIADAGDGIVVIGGEEDAAADAVANPSGGPSELIELLEPADQPVAQAAKSVDEECVVAFGGWENGQLSEGTVAILLDREADADAVELGAVAEAETVSTSEPEVDGESVRVPFTTEDRGPGSLVRNLIFRFEPGLYDCG